MPTHSPFRDVVGAGKCGCQGQWQLSAFSVSPRTSCCLEQTFISSLGDEDKAMGALQHCKCSIHHFAFPCPLPEPGSPATVPLCCLGLHPLAGASPGATKSWGCPVLSSSRLLQSSNKGTGAGVMVLLSLSAPRTSWDRVGAGLGSPGLAVAVVRHHRTPVSLCPVPSLQPWGRGDGKSTVEKALGVNSS